MFRTRASFIVGLLIACVALVAAAQPAHGQPDGPRVLVVPRPGSQIDPTREGTYKVGKWKYAHDIEDKGRRGKARQGKLYYEDKALEDFKEGDYIDTPWGRMHFHQRGLGLAAQDQGWLDTPASRIGRQVVIENAGKDARPPGRLDQSRPAEYESGPWRYVYATWGQGGPRQGAFGRLTYQGSEIVGNDPGDYVKTPWGTMYWHPGEQGQWGQRGWLALAVAGAAGALIDPAGEAIAPARIDPRRPAAYVSGLWRYVHTVRDPGGATYARAGQLFYRNLPIHASPGDSIRTPWGLMHYWGVNPLPVGTQGWVPEKPPGAIGREVDPTRVDTRIDWSRPGDHSLGKWRFVYTVWEQGTRSEGCGGQLFYDGKPLAAVARGDRVRTPWGEMCYWGEMTNQRFGDHGWTPREPADVDGGWIDPTRERPVLDLTVSGEHREGKWRLIQIVWTAGTPGSYSRLLYENKPIVGTGVGDFVDTPWGVLYYRGELDSIAGPHGWSVRRPPGRRGLPIDPTVERLLPAEKIAPDESRVYRFGKWTYLYAAWGSLPGDAGSDGQLSYEGRSVTGASPGDYVPTPWGILHWWGGMESTRGRHGWQTEPFAGRRGQQIDPAHPY